MAYYRTGTCTCMINEQIVYINFFFINYKHPIFLLIPGNPAPLVRTLNSLQFMVIFLASTFGNENTCKKSQ